MPIWKQRCTLCTNVCHGQALTYGNAEHETAMHSEHDVWHVWALMYHLRSTSVTRARAPARTVCMVTVQQLSTSSTVRCTAPILQGQYSISSSGRAGQGPLPYSMNGKHLYIAHTTAAAAGRVPLRATRATRSRACTLTRTRARICAQQRAHTCARTYIYARAVGARAIYAPHVRRAVYI